MSDVTISRQLAWQRRQIAEGRCRACGGLRDSARSTICTPCRVARREKARARSGSRPWEPGRPGRPPEETRLVDPQHLTSLSFAAWVARGGDPESARSSA